MLMISWITSPNSPYCTNYIVLQSWCDFRLNQGVWRVSVLPSGALSKINWDGCKWYPCLLVKTICWWACWHWSSLCWEPFRLFFRNTILSVIVSSCLCMIGQFILTTGFLSHCLLQGTQPWRWGTTAEATVLSQPYWDNIHRWLIWRNDAWTKWYNLTRLLHFRLAALSSRLNDIMGNIF